MRPLSPKKKKMSEGGITTLVALALGIAFWVYTKAF